MKGGGRIYIVAGVLLAVVAGGLLFYFLMKIESDNAVQVTPTPVPNVDVVVLATDVKAGTLLTGDMLGREPIKANDPRLSPDTVRDLSEGIDRMAVSDAKKGQLLKRGDLQALPFVLPKGKKAMAFSVDDLSTVAGLVRERDYVDVVISGKIKMEKKDAKAGTPTPAPKPQANEDGEAAAVVEPTGDQTVVKAVLQQVQVLKVVAPAPPPAQGQQAQQQQAAAAATPVPTPSTQAPQGRISNTKTIVVLALSDQEAELVKFALDTGNMQLILRGREDAEKEPTKGMTLDILIRDYGLPVPRPVVVDPTKHDEE